LLIDDDTCGNKKIRNQSILILNSIVSDIKQKVPFNAVLASENITIPLTGEVCFVLVKEITV